MLSVRLKACPYPVYTNQEVPLCRRYSEQQIYYLIFLVSRIKPRQGEANQQ